MRKIVRDALSYALGGVILAVFLGIIGITQDGIWRGPSLPIWPRDKDDKSTPRFGSVYLDNRTGGTIEFELDSYTDRFGTEHTDCAFSTVCSADEPSPIAIVLADGQPLVAQKVYFYIKSSVGRVRLQSEDTDWDEQRNLLLVIREANLGQ